MTSRIFCHFGPFFALLPPNNLKNQNFEKMKKPPWRYYHFRQVYHKWKSYDVWFLRYGAWQTELFVILDRFLPFYPSNNLKNLNFEKTIKISGDIIILDNCIINDNHMMYGSWDMKREGQNFLSFCNIFYLFTPTKTPKNQKILSFYTSVPKIMIICYNVLEIRRVTDVIVIFHFELFFALLPP